MSHAMKSNHDVTLWVTPWRHAMNLHQSHTRKSRVNSPALASVREVWWTVTSRVYTYVVSLQILVLNWYWPFKTNVRIFAHRLWAGCWEMTTGNVLLRYTDIFPITDFVHLLSSFLVSPPPPFLFLFYLLSIHSSLSPCPILFPFAIIQICLSFPLVSSFLSVLSSFTFSSHPFHIPILLLVSFQSFSAFSIPFLPLLFFLSEHTSSRWFTRNQNHSHSNLYFASAKRIVHQLHVSCPHGTFFSSSTAIK